MYKLYQLRFLSNYLRSSGSVKVVLPTNNIDLATLTFFVCQIYLNIHAVI